MSARQRIVAWAWEVLFWLAGTWVARKAYYRPPYLRCHGWEGPCLSRAGKLTRQHTSYVHEPSNWDTLCPECQKAADAYWAERWAEYWASVM